MNQRCRDQLAREITAVVTSDIKAAIRHLPHPRTKAQVWKAAVASAETLAESFQVRVERDPQRPCHFHVTLVVLQD